LQKNITNIIEDSKDSNLNIEKNQEIQENQNNKNNKNNQKSIKDKENLDTKNIVKKILKMIYENFDVFKYCFDLIKNEGVQSLFNGMSSSIFGGIVQNGIYFCAMKIFAYIFQYIKIEFKSKILHSMLINLLSAICSSICTNPFWVLNIRMANVAKEV